jgi:RNA polymerase sigma-70 factor, ECF subfamily
VRRASTLSGPAPAAGTQAAERDARLGQLVREHFEFVWRLLRRLGLSSDESDDLAQQVFMTATRKLDQIAGGSERTFLYGIALRVAANARRSKRRRREHPDEKLDAADQGLRPDEQAELARAWGLLDELLGQLPGPLRRALVLAEIEELEVAQIAALESIPVGTAASRLRRARAAFRELVRAADERNPFGAGDA